jgi:hypothetical protein
MNVPMMRGAIGRREPIGQIKNDAGKESRLGGADEKAHDEEAQRAGDEHHRNRQYAPARHDARDPAPRTEALQQQIARHFEEEIADEEHAGAETEGIGSEADILVHGQRGEADIDAVEIGQDVAGEQQREEAEKCLLGDRVLIDIHGFPRFFHASFANN